MKKASIAVALVLVFGLFAAAFSLTPAIAQYGTGPSSTPSAGTQTTDNSTSAAGGNSTTAGNTTTAGNATTSTNATSTNATGTNTTSTQGSTFSAKGSIATLIFDTGTTVTNNTNETGTSSANATSTSNATSSNMTSLGNTTAGNMTSGGNTTGNTTLSQTIVGGDNATGAGNATGSNMTSLGNTTAGNATSNATSTAALEQPYVLSGDWSLDVQGGTVSDFKANFTMVHIDGTMRHTHEVSNFKSANGSTVQLEQNGTTIIFGTADVSKDGSPKWTGVDAVITIDKLNVASISFASEDTDDHFHGQPIYGVVDSLTDENGNEMVQAGGTTTSGNATGGNMTSGGNATSNATQSGQSALNQTGNAINNVTQGVQDFLNGTG